MCIYISICSYMYIYICANVSVLRVQGSSEPEGAEERWLVIAFEKAEGPLEVLSEGNNGKEESLSRTGCTFCGLFSAYSQLASS